MLILLPRRNGFKKVSVHYKKYAYSTLSTLKYWIHLVISYYLELSYKWHLTPYPNQPPPPPSIISKLSPIFSRFLSLIPQIKQRILSSLGKNFDANPRLSYLKIVSHQSCGSPVRTRDRKSRYDWRQRPI